MYKSSLLGSILGGTIGAATAPSGYRWEGASRGIARSTGIGTGIGIGGSTAGLIGAGLGSAVGGLAGHYGGYQGPREDPYLAGMIGGGLLGGIPGAIFGGIKGNNMVRDYIGPASYDKANTKPNKGLEKKEHKKEHKKEAYFPAVVADIADTAISGGISGASIEGAKSYSNREDEKTRHHKMIGGANTGLHGALGSRAGSILGALAGGGLGALGGYGLGRLSGSPDMPTIGAGSLGLIGAGAGTGLGGYYGGRLGIHMGRPSTDIAKADQEKALKHKTAQLNDNELAARVNMRHINVPPPPIGEAKQGPGPLWNQVGVNPGPAPGQVVGGVRGGNGPAGDIHGEGLQQHLNRLNAPRPPANPVSNFASGLIGGAGGAMRPFINNNAPAAQLAQQQPGGPRPSSFIRSLGQGAVQAAGMVAPGAGAAMRALMPR